MTRKPDPPGRRPRVGARRIGDDLSLGARPSPRPPVGYIRMIFYDEFNDTHLDRAKWQPNWLASDLGCSRVRRSELAVRWRDRRNRGGWHQQFRVSLPLFRWNLWWHRDRARRDRELAHGRRGLDPFPYQWYYDGRQVGRTRTKIDAPMYAIVNLGTRAYPSGVPNRLRVEWVRVWQ
jgi:hypothetical protein